ncbi:hypothetical protein [Aromatoleum anaerobium]|uniref:Uncharacterized protein n=1 Tax=Aromatoleum anaerobium TaxID=182180 RepID=A0ABX1PT00_9RHOO|nr:hypothetical protein [Aromatoleum anaerobium]MCK0507368.1 hypothetical protein [Aromatoleum anaerobium]
MSAKTDTPLLTAAWNAVSTAHNATNLAYSCFADLATLFHAIADASDEHSQAAKLAKIGLYLAEDWANLHDCERETLEERFTVLRAALGLSPINGEGDAK